MRNVGEHNIILESERIHLEPFTLQDVSLFHQLNTDTFVKEYLWDGEIIPESLARELMDQNQQYFVEHGYGLWKTTLKPTRQVIGYTGLWNFFQEPQPQLIYALLEPFTGQGLAVESARLVMNYAFKKLKFPYLIAATDEPHVASQKVALSLGMRFHQRKIEDGKPTLFYRINVDNYDL